MGTIHVTSVANVETTLNMWFAEQLAAIDLPSYFDTAYTIAYEWPEVPLTPPCFSFNHISVMSEDKFMGNVSQDGDSVTCEYAIMEINAWVSRDQLSNGQDIWRPRLQFMTSMIKSIRTAFPTVVIQDTQSSPNFPLPVAYKINLGDMKSPETAPDPNPAIRRRRMLLSYNWMMRASL